EQAETKQKKKYNLNIIKGKNGCDVSITTNRQGLWSKKRKADVKEQKEIIEKRRRKKRKSAIEKYKEENAQDNTEVNVEALKRITELGKVVDKVAEKILYKQPCQLSRDLKEVVKETESSVFTEEDFKKFEREYRPK
ncbi:unnamed protein product, partial [Lymnaea stagnalis]